MADDTTTTPNFKDYLLSVDDAVAAVLPHRGEWQQLSAGEKSKLIGECILNLKKFHSEFEAVGLQRRGYVLNGDDNGDKEKVTACETEKALIPLLTSTHCAFWLSSLKHSFDHVAKTGRFPKPSSITKNSDGTMRLNVTPPDMFTWTASGFSTLELHVEDPNSSDVAHTFDPSPRKSSVMEAISGIPYEPTTPSRPSSKPPSRKQTDQEKEGDEDESISSQQSSSSSKSALAELQNDPHEHFSSRGGEVAAVLGAGNFDCPVDFLTAMFIENNVAVYKFSPLTEPLAIPFTEIFKPLISKGFLAFTSGGPKEGSQLLHNPEVAKWFMTGDTRTANRILFDSPESPFKDRIPGSVSFTEMSEKMVLKKPFTIELGNCSPYIVAPGEWSDRELFRHAKHLAFGLLMNGGHICAHPQIIVTCKNWPQRETFLKYVREATNASRTVGVFYPNGSANLEKFKENLSEEGHDLEKITLNGGSVVFAEDAKPTSSLLTEETFCCVSGEFPLDTEPTVADFLPKAVEFVNTKAHGSLAATIIAKTSTPADSDALDESILKLNYGSVGVNMAGLLTIYYPQLVWGGYPRGVDAAHLQSGIGFFGNSYGFRHPIKSVIRCSFLGPNHFLQVIPQGGEIKKFQKMFGRLTTGLCNQSVNTFKTGLIDYMKIGSGYLLNL